MGQPWGLSPLRDDLTPTPNPLLGSRGRSRRYIETGPTETQPLLPIILHTESLSISPFRPLLRSLVQTTLTSFHIRVVCLGLPSLVSRLHADDDFFCIDSREILTLPQTHSLPNPSIWLTRDQYSSVSTKALPPYSEIRSLCFGLSSELHLTSTQIWRG